MVVRAEPAPAGTQARLTSPVLVGRELELRRLLEAAVHPPMVAVVDGEAGVGKTRLVREALARPELQDRRVLVGHCQPLREPFPFGPVIEALRSVQDGLPTDELGAVAGALRPLIPELAEYLPPALEPLGDARAERHRLFRATLEVLRALGPAVCMLEDLHWSDDSTGDLLRFLVSELPDELCLVLTCRREDLQPSSQLPGLTARLPTRVARTHVSLAPLDTEQVRALVMSILQVEEVSVEFASYLHERTVGLPFAVEEVIALLADRRDLVQRDGRWARRTLDALEVPVAIRDSVLERFAGLSPDAKRVAQAAAVVGIGASEELVSRTAGLSPDRGATGLAKALTLGLLRETEASRLGFRHVLAGLAVYDSLEAPERRRLHRRAARALEGGAPPLPLAQIAHHFQHAEMPRRWIRYAEAAADLAMSLGNGSVACDLLAEAVRAPESSSAARARMAAKLGRAALGSLDHDRALAVLKQVLDEEILPVGVRGELRLYVGLLLYSQAGQAHAGRAEIARAVPELSRRPGLAARGMSVLSLPMSTEGHVTEHLAWMKRALDAACRARDPGLKAGVLVNQTTLLMHIGDPRAWRTVLDLPQDRGSAEQRRQLLRANGNLAHACTCIGEYGHAQSFLARGRQLSAEAEDPYLAAALDSTGLLLDWATGQWAGLEAQARKLSHALEDVPLAFVEAELALGLLQLARGEMRGAKAHLGAARETGLASGSVPVASAAAGGLARMLLARGDPQAAAGEALAALDLVRRKGIWVWAAEVAPVATEALLTSGRRAEAVSLSAETAAGLRGRDAPAARAALSVCRALLAGEERRAEQAARGFARAERAWLALPRPYEAARCRERQALVLLACGQERGKDLLLSALERFRSLGASWDAARVRRTLREHGVFRPWRGGRRGYGNRLSPREQEVVRLAASGRTNREIAEALVLSPRTVQDHLAKAMKKAGVRSRKALAALHQE